MNAHLKSLAEQVLQLPSDEREALVQVIVASVPTEDGVDAAWAAEVERRNEEIDNNQVHAIPLVEAIAKIRAELK
jgi:putative addiction module component (TIGR02574 family)